MQVLLPATSSALIACVAALIATAGVLYYKFKFTLAFRVGMLIVSIGAVLGLTGVIVGETGLDLQTSPVPAILLASIAITAVLILIFGVWIGFIKPIRIFADVHRRIANGELDIQSPVFNRSDEIGDLSQGIQDMLASLNLKVLVGQIHDVSTQLFAASQQMSSSSEEVNASSQEISSIAQQMSRGSQQQTEQINVAAKQSDEMKKEFEKQIKGIETASELIESISDQVNMLALNASIEAARAGEYGRGFAVVADNIRRLADESKQSLLNINSIIEGLRDSMGQAIDTITSSVQSAVSVSEETAAGAEEVSAATEEQAATMQELSASAQELSNLAQKLRDMISRFKPD